MTALAGESLMTQTQLYNHIGLEEVPMVEARFGSFDSDRFSLNHVVQTASAFPALILNNPFQQE